VLDSWELPGTHVASEEEHTMKLGAFSISLTVNDLDGNPILVDQHL